MHLLRILRVIHSHSMFHRPLLDVPDPFPSFCSTPPPSTPNSLPMTGIRRPSCATPPGGLLFGHLAESTPLTGYEPKTCIDVNSEHTPINNPSKRNRVNIEHNDLTTAVAASENSDGFLQQAASGSPQQVLASVVNPWLSADSGPAPGNWCEVTSQLQEMQGLCRDEKETEIWKVRKLCPKGEMSTSTWSGKLNCLFKENAQLRKDHLRVRQKWTQEIGNEEMLILPSIKPIENSNLKDWSCIRRINGQIRLDSRAKKNCQEIEELRRICREERERARQLRIDELSLQQERNSSTVSQLLTQIHDLQYKVNSLTDKRDFSRS